MPERRRIITSYPFLFASLLAITLIDGSLQRCLHKYCPQALTAMTNVMLKALPIASALLPKLFVGAAFLLVAGLFAFFCYRIYWRHKVLIAIEAGCTERFRFLSMNSTDNKKTRAEKTMTLAQGGPWSERSLLAVYSLDDGSQSTAQKIIDLDVKNMSKFKATRRSARLNALAYHQLLEGNLVAARDELLRAQFQAFCDAEREKKPVALPDLVPSLARLLQVSLQPDKGEVVRLLESGERPLGVLPVTFKLAIWFFRHPNRLCHTYKVKETTAKGVEVEHKRKVYGREALEYVRNI